MNNLTNLIHVYLRNVSLTNFVAILKVLLNVTGARYIFKVLNIRYFEINGIMNLSFVYRTLFSGFTQLGWASAFPTISLQSPPTNQ